VPARTRFYYFPEKPYAGNRLIKKGILPVKTISDIPQHVAYFICGIYQFSYILLSGQQAGFFWQQ